MVQIILEKAKIEVDHYRHEHAFDAIGLRKPTCRERALLPMKQ
jgi:hypothetical protein